MTNPTETTDRPTRTYVGYIPTDLPLAAALSFSLPYELPTSNAQCLRKLGKPGRCVVITITVEESPE